MAVGECQAGIGHLVCARIVGDAEQHVGVGLMHADHAIHRRIGHAGDDVHGLRPVCIRLLVLAGAAVGVAACVLGQEPLARIAWCEALSQCNCPLRRGNALLAALEYRERAGVSVQVRRDQECFLPRAGRRAFQASLEHACGGFRFAQAVVQVPQQPLDRLPDLRGQYPVVELHPCLVQQLAHADLGAHCLAWRGRGQGIGEEAQGCPGTLALALRDAGLLACIACLPECGTGARQQRDRDRCGRRRQPAIALQPQPQAFAARQRHRGDRAVVQPGAQVIGQCVCGGIARVRFAAQAGLHDVGQAAAQCARK